MRLITRMAAAGSLMALGIGGLGVVSAGAAPQAPIVGHVYVNDNTATANTIAAFDRHANGTLTPTAGSPFATGGVGSATGLASQGALQITPDGRFLLAVDAGSNQISVLRIKANDALQPVAGSPVSSGGIDPVSIAIDGTNASAEPGDLVYVANAGTGASNYTGFDLTPAGRLVALPGSTVALPDGSQPGDVLFNPTGTHLAGTRAGTSLIDSFTVKANGLLTAAPGSPFAAQGPGPFGSEFRPTNANQLFVPNAHGGANNGTVSAFRVSANATLTSIGAGPFPDLQTAPCWIEISHNGRFLFTVNTAVPSISRYSIAQSGSLTLLGSTPFHDGPGLAPVDARLSPDGSTLFVVDGGGHAVSTFAVVGGNLTEVPTSPTGLPSGAAPSGIVVI
jgi:6-phosphogluconolactonase